MTREWDGIAVGEAVPRAERAEDRGHCRGREHSLRDSAHSAGDN